MEIGQFTLPVVLVAVMGGIYKAWISFPNRAKPITTMAIGAGLGLVWLWHAGGPWDAPNMIRSLLEGFMAGAAAVGLYELQDKARHG